MKNFENDIYTNLPPVLREVTEPFEGYEKDLILLSSLGVVSVCLPNITGCYFGKKVYPNLYVIIIAPPASGKGIIDFSRILIEKVHSSIVIQSMAESKSCKEEKKKSKDKDYSDCPKAILKVIPGNISVSNLYQRLNDSKHGSVIIESKADTVSSMFNQEWGNMSELLRKAFHHEKLSLSRKTNDEYIEVNEPILSIVLTGTADQLKPLLRSRENGLFSRFLFYSFQDTLTFNDPFASVTYDYTRIFQVAGESIYYMYMILECVSEEIEITLSDKQKEFFNEKFSEFQEKVNKKLEQEFTANLRRMGLIMYKLCMIFTVLRNKDHISELTSITCSDQDFENAFRIINVLLFHSEEVFTNFESLNISDTDRAILNKLPDEFESSEFIRICNESGYADRSCRSRLKI
ncbi:MAG: DUF3987 domain-containing protein [Saprospiraceae bacterium]|nr:DUF3987 domain-containing protein [Saprospiraceae bacterium]